MLTAQETTWIIDHTTGELTVEGLTQRELTQLAGDLLPAGAPVNCARPINIPPLDTHHVAIEETDDESLQVFRIYHGSVVEGPGRRSVVQTSGCGIRCTGFIYSLKWAKYDEAHDRTKQQAFFDHPRRGNVAQPLSC